MITCLLQIVFITTMKAISKSHREISERNTSSEKEIKGSLTLSYANAHDSTSFGLNPVMKD